MSLQALLWVDELPLDVMSAGAFRVLLKLANRADERGRDAFPAVTTLARELGRTPRQIQRYLAELRDSGFIKPGDQQRVAHIPANRRPTVWDLCMFHEPVALAQQLDSSIVGSDAEPVDNSASRGDTVIHRGDIPRSPGVTTVVVHKEPSRTRSLTSSTTSTGARAKPKPTLSLASACDDSIDQRHHLPSASHPRFGRCSACDHRIVLACGHHALDESTCVFTCRSTVSRVEVPA